MTLTEVAVVVMATAQVANLLVQVFRAYLEWRRL